MELEDLDAPKEVMSRAEALAVSSPGAMEVDGDMDVSDTHANDRHVNGNNTKGRIKIEYERFAQIQNMVVMKLKEMQESNSQGLCELEVLNYTLYATGLTQLIYR